MQSYEATYPTKTQGAIFSGASVRIGKKIQTTEISIRSRKGTARKLTQTDFNTGENLVSKQKIQMQTSEARQEFRTVVHAPETGGRSNVST